MRKTSALLTRERILQAGLDILDEQGMGGLSMRKLAARLGVEAMSLYNHVKDKRDLLNGMADLVLSQIELPDPLQAWERRLETIAIQLYEALMRYPGLAMFLVTEQSLPRGRKIMQGIDGMMAALDEAGLDPVQQVNAYRGLLAMCFGFVFMHTVGMTRTLQQAQAEWDQWDSSQWDADTLPNLARLAPSFTQTHAADDIQFMLRAYIKYLQNIQPI
ncbi:MAG: TetR family transcriptional regulator [Chloroflexota bacterium]